jgi:hypothetical protein
VAKVFDSNSYVEIRDTAMRQMIDLTKVLGLRPDRPSSSRRWRRRKKMTDNPLPATPETINPHKPTEERKPYLRKKQYFTFEQVGDRAHKNAAFEAAWLLSV